MTDHTPMPKVSRLEVIATGARRRWTLDEKHRIVAESYGGRRLVSATAQRNGLSASQLFTWRRLAREGRLVEADNGATFAQAVITCKPSTSNLPSFPEHLEAAENLPSASYPVAAPGRMEIVLTGGRRIIVDNGVDAVALVRVIGILERRR
jgi:transposase